MSDKDKENNNGGKKSQKSGISLDNLSGKLLVITIIIILISIAIYNYDNILGYSVDSEGSFIFRALYVITALIGAIYQGVMNIFSMIGDEFWSVLIVLIVFLGIAAFISKDSEK